MNDNDLSEEDHAAQEARNEERAEAAHEEMAELRMEEQRMEEKERRKGARLRPIGRLELIKLYRKSHSQEQPLAGAKAQSIDGEELERFAQERGYTLSPGADPVNEMRETPENSSAPADDESARKDQGVVIFPPPLPAERLEQVRLETREWQNILGQVGVRRPSYCVGTVVSTVVAECERFAEANQSTGVEMDLEQLWLGLLSTGRAEQAASYRDVSLPAAIYAGLGMNEETFQQTRENILRATRFATTPGVRAVPALQDVFADAQSLKEACSKKDDFCSARHLVAALLQRVSVNPNYEAYLGSHRFDTAKVTAALKENLEEHEEVDDAKEWQSRMPSLGLSTAPEKKPAPPSRAAGAPAHGREAREDELCLDIHTTAAALADTIRVGADGDFCMALKGQWGRGKTTMMTEVENQLGQPEGDYKVVKFNVWKYPQRPEVWVHLYQRIVAAAHEPGLFAKWRLVFHQSLEAVGWGPLFGALLSLQIALLPVFDAAKWIAQGLGFFALVFVVFFTKNAGKFFRAIRLRYFTPADHTGHLGLQATVGQDLKNLLKVWVNVKGRPSPNVFCTLLVSLFLAGISWTIFYRVCGRPPFDFKQWTPAPYAGWWLVATALGCVAPWLLSSVPRGPKRVLLVVDDLDRCAAESMIHIIESIRLLLDDPEINQRLQTMILFDESLLNDALAAKFAARERETSNTPEAKRASEANIRRLVRGQLDKYFLLEFNLPPLTKPETKEYLETLLDWDQREAALRQLALEAAKKAEAEKVEALHLAELEQRANRDSRQKPNPLWRATEEDAPPLPDGPPLPASQVRAVTPYQKFIETSPEERAKLEAEKAKAREELERLKQTRKPQPAAPEKPAEAPPRTALKQFSFTPDERTEIRRVLDELPPGSASPRSIRSFLMRCQLAQFLLVTAKKDFNPVALIGAVGAAYFGVATQKTESIESLIATHVV